MIALLVVRPGPLLDGLNALLYAMPDIRLVAQANDADAALDFCRRSPVELIILEVKPGHQELLARVANMKAVCSRGQVLALIHDEVDWQPAEASGADLIMMVGIRAAEIKVRLGELVRPLAEAS